MYINAHRCAICNKTDNPTVETEIGDYTNEPFVPDPDCPDHDICMTCFESIRDSLFEFEEEELELEYDGFEANEDPQK